jgi:superfamily II DNA or RNA helicase
MVAPWEPTLEPSLTVRRKIFDPRSKTPTEKLELLYSVDKSGVGGYVPAGLAERVARALVKMRGACPIKDLRKWAALPTPDWSRIDLTKLRDGQAELLAAVASSHSGVIVAPPGFGKSTCLCFMCMVYPDAVIVVATPRVSVVRTIADRMKTFPALDGQVGVMCTGRNDGWTNRITVTTTKGMEKARYADCDLLVLDECHCAAAPGVSTALAKFHEARKWGLSASPTGRGDNADLLLEALIGPVRFEHTYQQAVSSKSIVQIDAMVVRNKEPSPGNYGTRIAMKRHCVWRNNKRNDLIASAARICSNQGQTLIMCETVEHVMELRKRLPGWVTVYAACDKARYQGFVDKGMTDEPLKSADDLIEVQKKFERGEINRAITTMTWREGVDFVKLAFLVRADSMSGEIPAIQITGRLSRTNKGKSTGILVDFLDEADTQMRASAWKKIKLYKAKGWNVNVIDGVDKLKNLVEVEF